MSRQNGRKVRPLCLQFAQSATSARGEPNIQNIDAVEFNAHSRPHSFSALPVSGAGQALLSLSKSSAILSRARGSIVLTNDGRRLIDFHSGAGALNYGHNNHQIKAAIAEYLASDAVVHELDIATPAKLEFMETFSSVILGQRGLQYRFQFTGPTCANAIDAALELSRKITGRQHVISFTHGYDGVTLGGKAAGSNFRYCTTSGIALSDTTFMPYDGCLGPAVNTADYLREAILDGRSGARPPAAILVETVQGKDGIHVAGKEWLRSIQAIARDVGALFIIDDAEMGCGRTGEFFSFEFAALSPDIVVMSNSLS